jgi:hypothetical protein
VANAWGLSWGGDNGAWGISWGSSGVTPPTPAPVAEGPAPAGGLPWYARPKRRRKYEEKDVIQAVIEAVAARQAAALELDELKRLEELERELQLKAIEWDSRYVELMNQERERLIHEEIGRLLRKKMQDDDAISLLLSTLI